MKVAAVILVCALGVLTGARPQEDVIKKDKTAMQGSWKVETLIVDGEKVPTEELEAMPFLVVTGDQMQWGDLDETKVTFKLDPSKNPAAFDQTGPDGKVGKAIYRINGDGLVLCVHMDGEQRPTAFESTPGSGLVYMVLKRVN